MSNPPDPTTLILSAIGAVTGVSSLLWNVSSWMLSGGRARVEFTWGVLRVSTGDVVSMPHPKDGLDLAGKFDETDDIKSVIVVTVRARRQAVTVENCTFVGPGGANFTPSGKIALTEDRPSLRVEAFESKKFVYPMNIIQRALYEALARSTVAEPRFRAVVLLGSGRAKKSKKIRFYVSTEAKPSE